MELYSNGIHIQVKQKWAPERWGIQKKHEVDNSVKEPISTGLYEGNVF